MTVSEMISQLKVILEEHGDIVVRKSYSDEYGYNHDEVSEVEAYPADEYVVIR